MMLQLCLPCMSFTALAFVGHSRTSHRNSPAADAFTEIMQLYQLLCMRVSHEFSMLHSRLSTNYSHKNTKHHAQGCKRSARLVVRSGANTSACRCTLTTERRVENGETTRGLPAFHSSLRKTSKSNKFRCKKVTFSLYRPGVAQRVGRNISLLFHDRGTRSG